MIGGDRGGDSSVRETDLTIEYSDRNQCRKQKFSPQLNAPAPSSAFNHGETVSRPRPITAREPVRAGDLIPHPLLCARARTTQPELGSCDALGVGVVDAACPDALSPCDVGERREASVK